MPTAGVAQLKARLSEYLEQVKAGEEVVVTERGKAVARLVPYTRIGPTPAELEEMERAGLIRRAKRKLPDDFWDRPLVPDPEGWALRYLLEEREEGR